MDIQKELLKTIMQMPIIMRIAKGINQQCSLYQNNNCQNNVVDGIVDSDSNSDEILPQHPSTQYNLTIPSSLAQLLKMKSRSGSLLTAKQEKELQLISHIYLMLVDPSKALAYNRKFIVGLLEPVDDSTWRIKVQPEKRKQ